MAQSELYYKIINSRTFSVVLHVTLIASGQIGEAHIAQMLVFGFHWGMEKLYYRKKTLLITSGTRTQMLI